MDHTYDKHVSSLDVLCRTCGNVNITKKRKKSYHKPRLCEPISSDILLVNGIDVSCDETDCHSKYICHKCAMNITTVKKRNSSLTMKSARQLSEQSKAIWCHYDPVKSVEDCTVCSRRIAFSSGCVQPGTLSNRQDLPTSSSNDLLIESNSNLMPDSQRSESPSSMCDASTSSTGDAIVDQQATIVNTPTIAALPSPIATSTPKTLVDSTTSPLCKVMETLKDTSKQPIEAPLSRDEEEAYTNMTRRKLYADPRKSQARCKTGGQPIVLQKIALSRKSAVKMKSPTKKRKSRFIKAIRRDIAGPSTESEDAQFAYELKSTPHTRRQSIYRKAGVKQRAKLSDSQTLAMKEALGLTCEKQRIQKRMLKEQGIHLGNEKAVRELANDIVGDFVKVETGLFLDESGVEKSITYSRVQNLPAFIDSLLEAYEKKKLLTWHQNSIPDDEIWLKIGGDHGKASMKVTLQVANTDKPNSRMNSVVIARIEAGDCHENLKRLFRNGLKEEIMSLVHHQWHSKSLKIILNGDYKFFTELYGLSGANGSFPCLWCLIPKSALQSKEGTYPSRNLDGLNSDHAAFKHKHGNDKKHAGAFNNCIHAPILPVEIDMVCPPYLHIMLGTVLKHHKLLEAGAFELDKLIITLPKRHLTSIGVAVKKYGANWKKARDMKDKVKELNEELVQLQTENDPESERKIREIKKKKRHIKKEYPQLPEEEMTLRTGPASACLDRVLNKHKIRPQAYHSRSFVGNHCHKYLNSSVYTDLTNEIVQQVMSCTTDQDVINKAVLTKMDFDILNKSLSEVHKLISHARTISPHSIEDIQTAIETYMDNYRRLFPGKTIPKQHILEHHCLPHIQKFGFGLGFLGEQGTENVHQDLSKIEHRARGFTNEAKKQEFINKTNLLQVAPSLRTDASAPKKRKIKSKDMH